MADRGRFFGSSRWLVPLLVLAGGWIAVGRLTTSSLVGWAALAAFGFAIAGEGVGPAGGDFVVFAGVVVGAAAAMLVGGAAVLVGLAGFGGLAALSALERRGLATKILTAALAGLPLMYGALAAGRPAEGILPWTLAAWVQLVRALIDQVERESPGAGAGPRSGLVIGTAALALAFVPASLLWPARAGYGGAYFLVVIFAELALLAVGTRLLVGRLDRLAPLVNGAMALGLIALVVGKVA